MNYLDLLLLLMILIWGSNFSIVKVALIDFPEIAFNAMRMIVATALAYAACAYFGALQTPLFRLVLAGAMMMAVYAGLMVLAMGKDFYLDLVRAMRNTSLSSSESRDIEGANGLSLTPK